MANNMSHQVRWTVQKIAQRIELIAPLIYRQRQPLPAFRYQSLADPLVAAPVGTDVDDTSWTEIQSQSYWGPWLTNFILRTTFQVPATWDLALPVALYLPLGDAGDFSHPEALAYLDGQAYASADRHHQESYVPDSFRDGQAHVLALHGWTGLGGFPQQDPATKLYMRECYVVQIDVPTRDFVAYARLVLAVAAQLEADNPITARLYNALDVAFQIADTRDPLGTSAFYDSIPSALQALQAGVAKAGVPLDVKVVGIGHAHIDVAWLWTLGQTVRKVGRTFSNVLRLMEAYPQYKFSQSQAQLYQYAEQHYPEIFKQVVERVKEGRWEPMGGTWVEPDCNAIGAESLARQFLLGRSYFRQRFGNDAVDTPVLWLPDTFGYSWALPQLIKLAGMKYFVTHKMSWNQYNQMPYQLLWWQGLDGTRVLTHFLTTPHNSEYLPYATTYNGDVSPRQIMGSWTQFRQKGLYDEVITAYGYGDGGGGPTRTMIDNIDSLADFPGMPQVRPGTVREFMDRIEQTVADKLPVWNGEFYLEYHRGTYTSQGHNKRANRKSEFLLHDAEFLAAWAAMATDYTYPYEDLGRAWELLCLNQFHDILPGSSIGAVYVESARDYQTIQELGQHVRESAIQALATRLPSNMVVAAVNTTSFSGRRIGTLSSSLDDAKHLVNKRGVALMSQVVEEGVLIKVPDMEPYSIVGLSEADGPAPTAKSTLRVTQTGTTFILENALIQVEINPTGDITRIYDKQADRDVLAPGTVGNALLAFEDRPMNFDAWDIDIFYEDRQEKVEGVERIRITESGPLRATVEVQRTYRSSRITQRIQLYHDGKRIDFDTWIDWHEQHTLLKGAFPVNVMSPVATFDVQWGNVQRPTHRNTPWDWARFETCAQKWADLSESNYGVALLNDCKYGYDVHDNVMRLSLLKSATSPDENADQGEHVMTYSLLPHVGDWRVEVSPAAYDLNVPLILRQVSGPAQTTETVSSLLSVSNSNVVIETVKRAEDGRGLIVRLFENQRSRGKFTLHVGFQLAAAYETNLLEEDSQPVAINGNAVDLTITPYQIINLRLIPGGDAHA